MGEGWRGGGERGGGEGVGEGWGRGEGERGPTHRSFYQLSLHYIRFY